jgi:hypothetical protein
LRYIEQDAKNTGDRAIQDILINERPIDVHHDDLAGFAEIDDATFRASDMCLPDLAVRLMCHFSLTRVKMYRRMDYLVEQAAIWWIER